jgi:sugar-phosphatase
MPTTIDARALLFDMDGTLIDSGAAVTRIWTIFATRYGLDIDELLRTSHGVQMVQTIRANAPVGTDVEARARELGSLELADSDDILAIPGSIALFEALGDSPRALVTSAGRELAVVRMAQAGLPLPTVLVSAEDVTRGKPQPDPYLLAAERLGIAPADCVVFEDADAGIRSGLAAGMRVVVVGELDSRVTAGLPRIEDYVGVSVSVGHTIRLTLP